MASSDKCASWLSRTSKILLSFEEFVSVAMCVKKTRNTSFVIQPERLAHPMDPGGRATNEVVFVVHSGENKHGGKELPEAFIA